MAGFGGGGVTAHLSHQRGGASAQRLTEAWACPLALSLGKDPGLEGPPHPGETVTWAKERAEPHSEDRAVQTRCRASTCTLECAQAGAPRAHVCTRAHAQHHPELRPCPARCVHRDTGCRRPEQNAGATPGCGSGRWGGQSVVKLIGSARAWSRESRLWAGGGAFAPHAGFCVHRGTPCLQRSLPPPRLGSGTCSPHEATSRELSVVPGSLTQPACKCFLSSDRQPSCCRLRKTEGQLVLTPAQQAPGWDKRTRSLSGLCRGRVALAGAVRIA